MTEYSRRRWLRAAVMAACVVGVIALNIAVGHKAPNRDQGSAAPPVDPTLPTTTTTDPQISKRAWEKRFEDAAKQPPGPPPVPLSIPASCPTERPENRVTGPENAVPGFHGILTGHALLASDHLVYALAGGSSESDPEQGVILVAIDALDPCVTGVDVTPSMYPMPERHGAIKMERVDGTRVYFTTTDGTTGWFDVVTHTYSPA